MEHQNNSRYHYRYDVCVYLYMMYVLLCFTVLHIKSNVDVK